MPRLPEIALVSRYAHVRGGGWLGAAMILSHFKIYRDEVVRMSRRWRLVKYYLDFRHGGPLRADVIVAARTVLARQA
ncbi:hypothetical protein GCM10023085_12740 [Actinomadura viridis]